MNRKLEKDAAEKWCQRVFGNQYQLASGFNEYEMDYVANLARISEITDACLFLSGERKKTTDRFYTTTGIMEHVQPKLWDLYQPNDYGGYSDYAVLNLNNLQRSNLDRNNAEASYLCTVYDKMPAEPFRKHSF